ncbi:MAG: ScyD/ScyE family protein [Acidobacteriota bacterium]
MKSIRFTLQTLLFLLLPLTLSAQTAQPFATGLLAPTKVIFTTRGNLLVAEQGNGPNTGRISVIDRITGDHRTILSGLPSGINTVGGEASPSGPDGLALQGVTLYVTIGSGDSTLPGPVAGSEQPNGSPSSPLFSSVLAIDLALAPDDLEGGLSLTLADQVTLKSNQAVNLGSGQNALRVRLIADFPDYRFESRPDFSGNVRSSNPFGLVLSGDTLFVVDASWNSVRTVNRLTGATGTLVEFPRVTNPNPAMGGPTVDPVPDSIHLISGRLFVTTLTGFPFPQGASRVYSIDPSSGAITTVSIGLSSAIDSDSFADANGGTTSLVLEFSTNMLAGAPGALLLEQPTQDKVIASGLITPTSMAVDRVTGEVYITELGPGLIVKVDTAGTVPRTVPPSFIPVVASTDGVGGSRFETTLQLNNPYSFPISGSLVLRPASAAGSASDPTLPYSLGAHETKNYPSLLPLFDRSGLGSIDIFPAVGPVPVAVVRIYETGSGNGFFEEQLTSSSILQPGQKAILLGPSDLTQFRMNIGVRTFGGGATIKTTVIRSSGQSEVVKTTQFPADSITQLTAEQLLGAPLSGSDSILIEVTSGSALVYGSIVNNATQASSIQIARTFSE